MHGMLVDGWTRSLLGLTSLNRGFLIRTDHPDPLFEQGSSVFIQAQDWASPLQEGFGILNMLPGVEAPGADLLSSEPAPNRSRRNSRQGRNGRHISSQFGATPMSQGNAMRSGQTAS